MLTVRRHSLCPRTQIKLTPLSPPITAQKKMPTRQSRQNRKATKLATFNHDEGIDTNVYVVPNDMGDVDRTTCGFGEDYINQQTMKYYGSVMKREGNTEYPAFDSWNKAKAYFTITLLERLPEHIHHINTIIARGKAPVVMLPILFELQDEDGKARLPTQEEKISWQKNFNPGQPLYEFYNKLDLLANPILCHGLDPEVPAMMALWLIK